MPKHCNRNIITLYGIRVTVSGYIRHKLRIIALFDDWCNHIVNPQCCNSPDIILHSPSPASHVTLEHEIACVDVRELKGETESSLICAVGLWTNISAQVLRLPSLNTLHTQPLGGGGWSLLLPATAKQLHDITCLFHLIKLFIRRLP